MDKSIFLVLLVLYNMTDLVLSLDAISSEDNDDIRPSLSDCAFPPVQDNGRWKCGVISCYLKCNPGYASLFSSTTCTNGAWTNLDKMECLPSAFLLLGDTNDDEPLQLYHPMIHNLTCPNPPSKPNFGSAYHVTFEHNGQVYKCNFKLCKSLILMDQSGQWKNHDISSVNRRYHSTVVIQNKVYFIGGIDEENSVVENVWTTLPLQNEPIFTSVPNLPYRGENPCVVKISEDSFVITGGAYRRPNVVKQYNVTKQSSIHLPQLQERRELHNLGPDPQESRDTHGCILVEEAGKQWIVVTGGYGSLNSTERLDLNVGTQWESLGQLNIAREGHGMIQTNKGIMVIGGYNRGNKEYLKSAEILDWSNKIWKIDTYSLSSEIAYFGIPLEVPAAVFKCHIYTSNGILKA